MKTGGKTWTKKCTVLCGLAIVISLWTACTRNSHKETLEIVGTGACEELLKKLADAYNQTNPGYKVIVPPSIGSGRGIKTVGSDEYILGRVARPLKEDEAELGLSYVVFASDPVVFATGNKVDVTSLTEQQLLDIFSGKITDWREVGGTNNPIRVLVREEGDSSRSVIESKIESFRDIKLSEQAKMAYHDYEMVELFEKYQTAIGYLTNSSVNSNIHPISIDGIAPTLENVSQGRYPLVCEYAFVYKESRLNDQAGKFLDFVFSEHGKRVLDSNGAMHITGQ